MDATPTIPRTPLANRILRLVFALVLALVAVTGTEAGLLYQGVSPTNLFWPGGIVPYQFETNVTAAQQAAYLDGIREWELAGNVRLVPRTNQSQYLLLRFYFQAGTNTFVLGTPNVLTVDSLRRNQLTHEMGHALGLQHEHVRPDRDSFITVNLSNLFSGASNLYVISSNDTPFGVYDFESTMHYGTRLFANDPNQDVMFPKPAYFAKYYYRIANHTTSVGDRAAIAYLYGPPATPISNVVTNTRDTGFGSLRAAIHYANDHPGTTITFNIATNDAGYSNGVWTIKPTGEFPALVTDGTVIDGGTQPGFVNHPVVALDGSALAPEAFSSSGLYIYAANCSVKKLAFNRFTFSGVILSTISATNNAIVGCNIGIDAAGTNAAPNAYQGVIVSLAASNNRIGGTNATDRNLLSGNTQYGVYISDSNTTGNAVLGNYIGLDITGTRAIPNHKSGIGIVAGATSNNVGLPASGARNVISGNLEYGVLIFDTNSDANTVGGNFIGTDAGGTTSVSNLLGGVIVANHARDTTIGGIDALSRNIISGNAGYGLLVVDPGTDNTIVRGNFIGTDPSGSLAVPNDNGIGIFNGPQNTIVGGGTPTARNVVSGNRSTGIFVGDTTTIGTIIRGNYIGVATNGTSALGNGWHGVYLLFGPRNTIIGGTTTPNSGNLISGNGGDGIAFYGDGTINNVVTANLIGTDKTGTTEIPNATGVSLSFGPEFNTIGGASAGERNVISGNNYNGVYLGGYGTTSNSVLGNLIGTTLSGTTSLGNNSDSLALANGASNNLVGGTTSAARNIIAAGTYSGVWINGPDTSGNVIQGNFIGTDTNGNVAFGNGYEGVAIYGGAHDNVIGGTAAGSGNVIGGSGLRGVYLADAGTTRNRIQGNSIGVGANGAAPLANGYEGIAIINGASSNIVGIALDGSGAGNRIANSTYSGIYVGDATTTGNTIRGNSIYSNGQLAINLIGGTENGSGVTANDSGDADTGPNNLQNFPTITNGVVSGGSTFIKGNFNSTANRSFLLDFYRNTAADPSGYGEGENYLGVTSVTTDGVGNANFNFNTLGIFTNQLLTATATDTLTGDTSEFSLAVAATIGAGGVFPIGVTETLTNGTNLTLTLALQTNRTYRVQATTNLVTPNWIELTNFVSTNAVMQFKDVVNTNFARRFYRVTTP